MKSKVSMVILSNLSDLQAVSHPPQLQRTILNFIKYLVMKYPNTDVEVDGGEEYSEFRKKHPSAKQGGILNKEFTFKQLFTK